MTGDLRIYAGLRFQKQVIVAQFRTRDGTSTEALELAAAALEHRPRSWQIVTVKVHDGRRWQPIGSKARVRLHNRRLEIRRLVHP